MGSYDVKGEGIFFLAQKGGCPNDFLEGVVLDDGWYDLLLALNSLKNLLPSNKEAFNG